MTVKEAFKKIEYLKKLSQFLDEYIMNVDDFKDCDLLSDIHLELRNFIYFLTCAIENTEVELY